MRCLHKSANEQKSGRGYPESEQIYKVLKNYIFEMTAFGKNLTISDGLLRILHQRW